MKVFFALYEVEYREGMVIATMGGANVAESPVMELTSVARFEAARKEFIEPFVDRVNAKLAVYSIGRKFRGFDSAKREPVELHDRLGPVLCRVCQQWVRQNHGCQELRVHSGTIASKAKNSEPPNNGKWPGKASTP